MILNMLNRITGEIFEDQGIQKMEALISFGMLPLFLFYISMECTYLSVYDYQRMGIQTCRRGVTGC